MAILLQEKHGRTPASCKTGAAHVPDGHHRAHEQWVRLAVEEEVLMSQPPYGPPGSTGDSAPQYNPNTGLPESQPGQEGQQYGSDPYSGGQYGSSDQYGSQPAPSYGSDPYASGQTAQYGAPQDPYGTGQPGQYDGQQGQYGSQPGQYGGDQYSSDQYAASAAASPYGSYGGDQGQFAPIGGYGQAQGESDKSFIVTWLLGWLLGGFGADRFYLGKIGTAIAKLVTAGGFGIWALIDLIMHLVGATRDKQGRRLAGYDQHKKKAWIITIGVWLLQVVIAIIVTVIVAFTGGFSVSGGVSTGNGPQPSDSSPADPGDDQGDDTGDDTGDQGGDTGQQASGDATAWAESTFGTFDPVTVDGSGDEIVPMPDGIDAAIVTIEVKGDRARATAVDDAEEIAGSMYLSGQSGDTLQSDVGIDDYRETAGIDVSGSGDWTLTFAPISSAPALPESGSDSGIFLYDGDGGPVTFDYVGDSNFIVHQLGDGGTDLLANEIDSWSGDAEMVPGPSIVRVQASGDWTITPG
jgi:hypothetical protein